MTITKKEIDANELINEFTTVVRNFVTSNTNFFGNTVLNDRFVYNIIQGTGPGTASTGFQDTRTADAGGPVVTDIKPEISAGAQVNSLRTVIASWMAIYSRTQRVTFTNIGNLGVSSHTGVYRFTSAAFEVNAVKTATTSAMDTANLTSLKQISKTDLQNLVNSLQTVWQNNARDVVQRTYSYNYCHSSCHSSRSRR